jgi:2-oxoglutarate dehydrogenase E1 component
MDEFTTGGFRELIADETADASKIKRILLCTGKLYYDLHDYSVSHNISNVLIVRIEQLYPFPTVQFSELIARHPAANDFVWVQEEPENMGAWSYLMRTRRELNLRVISREESASPATGSPKMHARQQKEIIEKAFENIS